MRLRPGNAQHQGAREAQQDSFGFSDLEDAAFVRHAGLAGVVADGMGGLAHGGAAGAAAVRALLHAYAAKAAGESIPAALLRAVRHANEAVVQLARAAGQPDEVGTTVAAVVVNDAMLHWIAVGDTRVYLWRGGILTQVTADHVYAAQLAAKVAAGQLSEQAAREHPDRDALTSHLGVTPLPAIDRSMTPFPLIEGDRVVVCSDGLYRALTAAEMAEPLAGAPQAACEALVDRVVAKRLARQDNLTAIVVGLDGDEVITATITSAPAPVTAAVAPAASRGGLLRRWLRGAAVMLWALALVALVPAPAAADLDTVPGGVVHLFVISPRGSISTGSGFVINDQSAIVTNHHVIAMALEESARIFVMNEQEAAKLAPALRGKNASPVDVFQYAVDHLPGGTVAWSDPEKDLAVVTPSAAIGGHPLTLAPGDLVQVGDRVVAFGFPGLNRAMGTASVVTLDRRPGEITSKHVESSRNRGVFATSAESYQGMSGGPAVNACGEVIAVVVGGFSRPVTDDNGKPVSTETINIFIQADSLIEVLKAHNVPFSAASARCAAASSAVLGVGGRDPVLTGGVLMALAMGCAALALAVTRRGRNAVRAATDSVSRRLSRRGDAGPRPPAAVKAPVMAKPLVAPKPEPSASAVLYGLSGEYDGVELELGDEPVAIGRDPRVSHLVFSPDAKMVSGRHCGVWYDRASRAAMVEDYWSTNGTYLADGRRLSGGQPQPLRSAEQFYLGDPGVLFEVRY